MPGEITLAQLYRNYIAAGFPADGFLSLTPRLYAMQMHGALSRHKIEMTMRNHSAWNTAALVAAAFAGKMPRYDDFFRVEAPGSRAPQTPQQMETALRALAAAWGAENHTCQTEDGLVG